MKNQNSYDELVTYIRAIDLIKVANQLFNDNMQFVKLSIKSSNNEDLDGSVSIHAIPTVDSNDVKEYPLIPSFSLVDFD